jgi:molybdate transport system substrate-binding protein
LKFQILKIAKQRAVNALAIVIPAIFFPVAACAEEAIIALAANFKDTADKLEADFESRTGHDIILTAGSTGKLYAQIVNGAPFDIFLAADQVRPRLLEERNKIVQGSRFTFATGRLVLWSSDASRLNNTNGAVILSDGDFRRLAIANPDLAPYGAAAREVMQNLGTWEVLQSKIVMGENISQGFTFVATGNAELGFVALSSVLANDEYSGSYWEPPPVLYTPIKQDAVWLKRAENNKAAQDFLAYLKSDDARAIIADLGYRIE